MRRRRRYSNDPKPHKEGSSYFKIHEVMLADHRVRLLMEALKDALKTAHVKEPSFGVRWDNEIEYHLKCELGSIGFTCHPYRNDDFEIQFPVRSFAQTTSEDVENALWGTKGCPTYNCNKSNLQFNEALENYLRARLVNEITQAQARLKQECKQYMDGPEFAELKKDFIGRSSIEAIKDAMKKFPYVSDQYFEQALHEFLTERIIEQ